MNYSFVLKILSLDKHPLIFLQPLYDFNIRQELKHTLQVNCYFSGFYVSAYIQCRTMQNLSLVVFY